jgi:hypothetical protein
MAMADDGIRGSVHRANHISVCECCQLFVDSDGLVSCVWLDLIILKIRHMACRKDDQMLRRCAQPSSGSPGGQNWTTELEQCSASSMGRGGTGPAQARAAEPGRALHSRGRGPSPSLRAPAERFADLFASR